MPALEDMATHLAEMEALIRQETHAPEARQRADRLLRLLQIDLDTIQLTMQQFTCVHEQMQALGHISALINSSLEVDRVLEEVADAVNRLTQAKRTYLLLRDHGAETLTIRAARDADGNNLSRKDVVFSRTVVDKVLASGQTTIEADAGSDGFLRQQTSIVMGKLQSILCIPLTLRGGVIGVLYADNYEQSHVFNESLLPLLTAFGNQAAIAIENAMLFQQVSAERDNAIQLTVELQQSRGRIVTAREEERRLLGGNLHDQLGPTLDSLVFKIDKTRECLLTDVNEADAELKALQDQIHTISGGVRDLAHNLRPAALERLGLRRALQEHITGLNRAGLTEIAFQAPNELPPLSAAVETAVYRITMEALTNVMRHAKANHCQVKVKKATAQLHLEIRDDGCGFGKGKHLGIGLHSMQERAAELGGECQITSSKQGTQIAVTLPLLRK